MSQSFLQEKKMIHRCRCLQSNRVVYSKKTSEKEKPKKKPTDLYTSAYLGLSQSPTQAFLYDEAEQSKEKDNKGQAKLGDSESSKKEKTSSGSSSKLPDGVRGKIESSMGADFSDVKVHTNSAQAENIGALAYTQGSDVYFAPGQYKLDSQEGQELIGHELAHVVQQKHGRVKPDAQQNKGGINLNTDASLEKEADEAGVKAVQGKMAEIEGKGSGVQRQEGETNKINVLAEDRRVRDDVVVENMNLLGKLSYESAMGTQVNYVLSGTKEQWSTILKYADSSRKFQVLIYGFLMAAVHPSWISRPNENPFVWNVDQDIQRAPNDVEILEFLKALYGVGVDTELDLADKSFEQPVLGVSNEIFNNPAMAAFIEKYQGMLIRDVSDISSEDVKAQDIMHFDESKIKAVADQGTTFNEVVDQNPIVVKAMIQNAVATALSASKCYLEAYSIQGAQAPQIDSLLTSQRIVINSATIIKCALSAYGNNISAMEKNASRIFEQAWSLIPSANILTGAILGKAKEVLSGHFIKAMEFDNVEDLKTEYENIFENAITKMTSVIGNEYSSSVDVKGMANANGAFIGLFSSHLE